MDTMLCQFLGRAFFMEKGLMNTADVKIVRDQIFDPYRTPNSDAMWDIVVDVKNQLENYEKLYQLRKRVRRSIDQHNLLCTEIEGKECSAI